MATSFSSTQRVPSEPDPDIGLPSIPIWVHDSLGCKTLQFVSPTRAGEMDKYPSRQFSDGTWSGLSAGARAMLRDVTIAAAKA